MTIVRQSPVKRQSFPCTNPKSRRRLVASSGEKRERYERIGHLRIYWKWRVRDDGGMNLDRFGVNRRPGVDGSVGFGFGNEKRKQVVGQGLVDVWSTRTG